eukprot:g6982.t1
MATEYARKLLQVDRKRPPAPPPSARAYTATFRTNRTMSNRYRPNVYNKSINIYENGGGKTYIPKSKEVKAFLTKAITQHYLFEKMDKYDIADVVNSMQSKLVHRSDTVIQQGTPGDLFYVLQQGECEVFVQSPQSAPQKVATYEPGAAFGELALLYSSPRNASVVATKNCALWTLNRSNFRRTIQATKTSNTDEIVSFLSQVPSFENLSLLEKSKIAEVVALETYATGDKIIKEGDTGDKFYIIKSGACRVFSDSKGSVVEVGQLKAGDFFGEAALLTDAPRNATVEASSDIVDVMYLDKGSFELVLGPLKDLMSDMAGISRERSFELVKKQSMSEGMGEAAKPENAVGDQTIQWEDLKQYRTLGTGTFGRVKLMEHRPTGKAMALKCMQKKAVVSAHQDVNIHSEKTVMLACNHPFIIKLYRTFQDADSIYMLLELVQGGELWSLLYQNETALPRSKLGGFKSFASKFYAACVVSCFEHIHKLGVAYRDLKPENLLLGANGYLKMVDFGFAKKVPYASKGRQMQKTFTLCGTPEYLAPEIIQHKGHDQGVDWWACGILIYELLAGDTPFCDPNQQKIFQKILKSERNLKFTTAWDRDAMDIIRRLLVPESARRLGRTHGGVAEIKGHPWFKEINWERHYNLEMAAPYVPNLKGDLDASMFDPYPEEDRIAKFTGDNSLFSTF